MIVILILGVLIIPAVINILENVTFKYTFLPFIVTVLGYALIE